MRGCLNRQDRFSVAIGTRNPFQDTRTDTRTGGTYRSRSTVPVLKEPEPALLYDLVYLITYHPRYLSTFNIHTRDI
jgi:hypothetical protein